MGEGAGARRKILYFSHTRQVSGAERVLLNMLGVLDTTRYVAVLACPQNGAGNLDELVSAAGVEVVEVPALQARFTSKPLELLRYLQSAASAIGAFRLTIREVRPDLIHANSVRAGLVATLATSGMRVKVLWHVQDDLPRHAISEAVRRVALGSRRTSFVAVSAATARAFAAGTELGKRTRVLHNAVDAARFPKKTLPFDDAARAFRAEFGLEDGDFLFAAVGMINRRKGLTGLVASFHAAAQAEPRARLAIVGAPIFNNDAEYDLELKAGAEALGLHGRVLFAGARKDVAAVLRAADVLVLNAMVEPFGLVILEAMASGTPVIATRVGGIPEIVEEGVSGVLVASPAGGTSALTDAMVRAVREPQEMGRLAERAYAEVVPRFSLEAFGAGLNAMYDGMFEGRTNG